MAYTDYLKNPDGTYTFTDPMGGNLTAAGPAAYQKAQEIDLAKSSGSVGPSPVPPPTATLSPDIIAASAPRDDQLAMGGNPLSDNDISMIQEHQRNADAFNKTVSDVSGWFGSHREKARFEAERRQAAIDAVKAGQDPTAAANSVVPPVAAPEGGPAGGAAAAPAKGVVMSRAAQGGGAFAGQPSIGGVPINLPSSMTGQGGGQVIPAHEQMTGRQVQRTEVPDEAVAQDKRAAQGQWEAQQGLTDAQVKQSEAIAAATREGNAEIERQRNEAQAREGFRQSQIKDKLAQVENLNQQIQDTRIDDQAFWKNKSQGEKFAAGLAVAMGALGAAMTGSGQNVGLQIINKAIDDKIDADKTNLANKRAGAQSAQNLVGMYREVLGDERAADAGARQALLSKAIQHIDEVTKDTQSEQVKAQGEASKAALVKQWADENMKLQSYVQHESYAEIPAQRAGAGNRGKLTFDIDEKNIVPFGTGADGKPVLYNFRTDKEADAARSQLGLIGQQRNDVAELKNIVNNPANLADPKVRARAETLSARIKDTNAKATLNVGRMSKEAIDLTDTMMGGDPNAIMRMPRSKIAALDEMQHGLTEAANSIVTGQHAQQVGEYWDTDVDAKTGKAVAKRRYIPVGRTKDEAPDVRGNQVGE